MSSRDNIIKFEEARRNVRSSRSASASRSRSQRPSASSSRTRSTGRSPVTPSYRSRGGDPRRNPAPYNTDYGYYQDSSYDGNPYYDVPYPPDAYRPAGAPYSDRGQSRRDRSLRNDGGYTQNNGYDYDCGRGRQRPRSATRPQSSYQDPFQGLYREYRESYCSDYDRGIDLGFGQEPMPEMSFDPYDIYSPYQDDYGMQPDFYADDEESREPTEVRFERSKREERRREKKKKRADKKFFKQFGSGKDDLHEDDPRAAVYEYEMGAEHRRAYTQLSEHQEDKTRSRAKSKDRVHKPFYQRKLFKVTACALFTVIAIGVFLYPGAQQYYIEMRNHDRVQAEYEAVVERNEALQNDVNHLQTDEGIEDAARTDLGLVSEGENAVTVTDLPEDIESTSGTTLHPQIPSGSVEAPETWYSKFLDPFFGYSTVAQV